MPAPYTGGCQRGQVRYELIGELQILPGVSLGISLELGDASFRSFCEIFLLALCIAVLFL